MRYLQAAPSLATSHFVKCYWYLEDETPDARVERIVPDGRPELIFNLGSLSENASGDGWVRQREAFFVGQITGPFLVRGTGLRKVFGVRFHPNGARCLFRIPAHELTDTSYSLEDISHGLLPQLQQLRETNSLREQFAILDQIMRKNARRAADDLIAHVVDAFESSKGQATIERAARGVGLSSRQLERRFRAEVGIPPKLFSRMQRFQQVFPAMEEPGADWVSAAVQCGYYDQAHLIRDFQEFSGKTPTALLAPDENFARHFLQSASVSHFSNTSSIARL